MSATLRMVGRVEAGTLRVHGPEHDPCFMPVGHGRLCMLPGTHSGGCLPAPPLYPPTVTVAVAA